MGLLDYLSGKTDILKYGICFDGNKKVSISINPVHTTPNPEYIRLYACYTVKMIYNFGGYGLLPSEPITLIMNSIDRAANYGIENGIDLFELSGLKEIIEYRKVKTTDNTVKIISGTYFDRDGSRSVTTDLPQTITEQEIAFGSIALLQFATDQNSESMDKKLLIDTCKNLHKLIKLYGANSIQQIIAIPNKAYLEALIK